MTRPIPRAAIDFTAAHEGLRLTAYLCPANVLTIGYGSTGDHVKPGMTITKAKALLMLRDDMQIAVRKLYSVLKPGVIDGLTDNQWSALLSFAFNVGARANWTLWKHINAGKLHLVPAEIMRFTRANGKVLNGLVRRRTEEVALWNAPTDDDEEEVPSSAVLRQPGITPPVTDVKPLAQSKTLWTGAGVAAAGVVQGAQQIQAIVAPQAQNSEWVANLMGIVSAMIVAAGVAIIVFKWLDQRSRRL